MLRITKPPVDGNNGRSNGNGRPAKINQRLSKHLLERRREKLKPRPRNPYDHHPRPGLDHEDQEEPAQKSLLETAREARKQKAISKSKAKSAKPARAGAGDGQVASRAKPKAKPKSKTKKAKAKSTKPAQDTPPARAGDGQAPARSKPKGKDKPVPDARNEPPFVFVPLWIIKAIGANTAAILLAQTLYWLSPARGRPTRLKPTPKDGRSWTPSCREITEQTGLSRRQIDGALGILVKRKRIEPNKAPGSRRRVIRLTKRFHLWLLSKGHLTTGPKIYSGRGVKVRAAEVAVTGSIPQALVLSNILFWWEPNSEGKSKLTLYDPKDEGGHGWRYYTRSQMAAETGLNPGQVKTALRSLRRDRLIVTRRRTCRSRRTGDFMTLIDVRPNLAVLDQQHGRQSSE